MYQAEKIVANIQENVFSSKTRLVVDPIQLLFFSYSIEISNKIGFVFILEKK
jgi:hypothetical protein